MASSASDEQKNHIGKHEMLDIQSLISQLRRPRLLVRAARFGVDDYDRERDLPRVLKTDTVPKPGDALMQLMGVESELDDQRSRKDALYAVGTHIDTLTAIMGEARILQATTRTDITSAT